jgi:type I restriction enzyme S subunit
MKKGENIAYLPDGWSLSSIDDLIGAEGLFMDGDWIESKDQDLNGSVRLIQLADIGEVDFKDKSNRYMTFDRAKELGCTFLKQDDILVARMPEPLGRATLFPLTKLNGYVTVVDVAIIRPGKNQRVTNRNNKKKDFKAQSGNSKSSHCTVTRATKNS